MLFQLLQIEVSAASIQRDLDKTSEERDTLQDSVENLQAQLDFNASEMAERESQLVAEKDTVKGLKALLQSKEEKLADEVDASMALRQQLETKGNFNR